MDIQEYYIPKHLDSSAKIVFWQVDEFMMFFTPIVFGLFLEQLLIATIVGYLLYINWRKIKGIGKGNVPLFCIYWFLPELFSDFKKTSHSNNTLFV
jgi:type IV conjugative transfer system protein TraL